MYDAHHEKTDLCRCHIKRYSLGMTPTSQNLTLLTSSIIFYTFGDDYSSFRINFTTSKTLTFEKSCQIFSTEKVKVCFLVTHFICHEDDILTQLHLTAYCMTTQLIM